MAQRKLKHRKALLLATAGGERRQLREARLRSGHAHPDRYGDDGVLRHSRIELHLLFDVLDDRDARTRHLAKAQQLGERYFGTVGAAA